MRIIDYVDFNSITSLMSENSLIPNLSFSITDLEGKTFNPMAKGMLGISQNMCRGEKPVPQ